MDKVNEKATIYDYIRMCKSFEQDCRDCPLFTPNDGRSCRQVMEDTPNKANEIILNWCEEHPTKTRQSELLKAFPNVPIVIETVNICPLDFDKLFDAETCKGYGDCTACKKIIGLRR